MQAELYRLTLETLLTPDSRKKAEGTTRLVTLHHSGELKRDPSVPPQPVHLPGYPPELKFVPPRELAKRGPGSDQGRIHLFHAIAHIEFSAINLALDAVYRFRDLPDDFIGDWLRVAAEEVSHFALIEQHLAQLGTRYGDLAVHDGLWKVARNTAQDPLVRMALVPRYLEARGLDVNPGMQQRLREAGDLAGVEILEVILRDEIGHVACGDRWFRYLCQQRQLEPETTYRTLVEQHTKHPWGGPIHCTARQQAGFSARELAALGCDH